MSGEVYENSFHCCYKWEGDIIVSIKCCLDLKDIMEEAARDRDNNQLNYSLTKK